MSYKVCSYTFLARVVLPFSVFDFVMAEMPLSAIISSAYNTITHWKTNLCPFVGLECFVTEAVQREQGAMI